MSQVVTTPLAHESASSLKRDRTEGILVQNVRTSLPLFFADVVGLAFACSAALLVEVVVGTGSVELNGFREVGTLKLFGGICVAVAIAFYFFDLYPAVGMSAVSEFRSAVIALTVVVVGIAAAWYSRPAPGENYSSFVMLLVLWLVALAAVPLLRAATRSICSHFDWWSQPILVVGGRDTNAAVFDAIQREPERGLRPIQMLGESDQEEGSPVEVAKLCKKLSAHRAIFMSDSPNLTRFVAPGCGLPHVHVLSRSDQPSLWSSTGECAGLPEVHFQDNLLLPASRIVKRIGDLAVILLAAPLLLPLCCVISLLIKFSSPGPVLYRQRRLGAGGVDFFVWKFRSMVINADEVLQEHLASDPELQREWEQDHKLKNDPRTTRLGTFLRKTSLDELPQLWNVLLGEMSLVGPRPIVDAEIEKYGDVYPLYKQVTPGITGIWQISGRNNTTYEQRLSFDRYYVKNWSPWLDAYILLRTVKTVLLREGAY